MNYPLHIEGVGAITPFASLRDFPHGPRGELPKFDLSLLERSLRRGLSDLTRLFLHAAKLALADAGREPGEVQVVFASAFGELGTAEALIKQACEENSSSPARFRHSVHNSAPGLFSIASQNPRSSTAIAAGWNSVAMALLETGALLRQSDDPVLLVFAEEEVPLALSADERHAPLGVAFVIAGASQARRTRAHATVPHRATPQATELVGPFAGESHPLAGAVALAEAVSSRRAGMLQLNEEPQPWCVRIAPAGEAESCSPADPRAPTRGAQP